MSTQHRPILYTHASTSIPPTLIDRRRGPKGPCAAALCWTAIGSNITTGGGTVNAAPAPAAVAIDDDALASAARASRWACASACTRACDACRCSGLFFLGGAGGGEGAYVYD